MLPYFARQCKLTQSLKRHFCINIRQSQKRPLFKEEYDLALGMTAQRPKDKFKSAMKIEEPVCHFPIIEKLGVTTDDEKNHSIKISLNHVLKFINMGFINKNLALQYCHYLVYLGRNSINERAFYGKRSTELLSFLFRNREDDNHSKLGLLACDVATLGAPDCLEVCRLILNDDKIELTRLVYTNMLDACHRFHLWREADLLLKKCSTEKIFAVTLFDRFVPNLIQFATVYKKECNVEKKKEMRTALFNHFFNLMELCHRDRLQLITSHKEGLIHALKDLGVKIVIGPRIKRSGRCLSCDNHIPLFDNSTVSKLHKSIEEILNLRVLNSLLYTERYEIETFKSFFEKVHRIDKKPINCVIDGLNICFLRAKFGPVVRRNSTEDLERSHHAPDRAFQAQIIMNTILRGSYLDNHKKILIIGRQHMIHWPGLAQFLEKYNIHFYPAQNGSNDDLLMLYAATSSPDTVLVTNDFLRDHLGKLGGVPRNLLERWIDTHQVWTDRKTLLPMAATNYEKLPSLNREEGYFHLPIIDYDQLASTSPHVAPPHVSKTMTTWVCCYLEDEESDKEEVAN